MNQEKIYSAGFPFVYALGTMFFYYISLSVLTIFITLPVSLYNYPSSNNINITWFVAISELCQIVSALLSSLLMSKILSKRFIVDKRNKMISIILLALLYMSYIFFNSNSTNDDITAVLFSFIPITIIVLCSYYYLKIDPQPVTIPNLASTVPDIALPIAEKKVVSQVNPDKKYAKLALMMYAVSFLLPALDGLSGWTGRSGWVIGFGAFLGGFFYLTVFAHILLIPIFICYYADRPRGGYIVSFFAMLSALTGFLALANDDVRSLLIGYYVWLASYVLIWIYFIKRHRAINKAPSNL